MASSRVLCVLLLGAAACGDNTDPDPAAEVTHAPAVETTVNEDGSVAVTVPMAGDAGAMSFSISTKPSHGRVTGAGPQFLYHPGVDFAGKDSFRVTMTDASTKQRTIVPVFIGIDAVNDPPVADDDQFTTAEDTDLVIPASAVLANDADIDSKLTVVAVTQPDEPGLTPCLSGVNACRATVTLDGDKITYHPRRNFSGTQTFTYTASDGQYTSTATVAVNVAPVNDAPYAFNFSESGAQDQPIVIAASFLAGWNWDPDGDSVFVNAVSNPSHGTVEISSIDDDIVFTPEPGYVGVEAGYDYTISDGWLTSTAHVYLEVTHVNHAPTANDDSLTVTQNGTVALGIDTLLANDTDPDGDTLVFLGTTAFPAHGSFVPDVDGVHYVPDRGYVGPDSFTYQISDGELVASATVHVTVEAGPVSGQAPSPINMTLGTFPDCQDMVLSMSAYDPDTDSSLLHYQVTSATAGEVSMVDATSFQYFTPCGFDGDVVVSWTVSDDTNNVSVGTTTFHISSP